jgi:hypothetical protein
LFSADLFSTDFLSDDFEDDESTCDWVYTKDCLSSFFAFYSF